MEFPDEVYRDVCSIKTLYSQNEGFFKDFVGIMLEEVDSDWIENVFKKQTSDSDKIRVFCSETKVWSAVQKVLKNVSKVYRKKSKEAAGQSRHQGDLCCKIGDYKKALMIYSQSIIRAPQNQVENEEADGQILPLAYKGRANALFHLGHYEEALADLNLALKEKLSHPLKYQIFRQMGECHKKLLNFSKARISLQLSLKLLDEQIQRLETTSVKHETKTDKLRDSKLMKILHVERKEITQIMSELSNQNGAQEEQGRHRKLNNAFYHREPLPVVTGTPNERYPNASSLLKIRQSAETGRFAASADRIPVGATLVVEEPQASLLVAHMLSSHCHHCFTRLLNPVPCKTCSGVAFCTSVCRDAATSGYHKYECQLLGLFLGSGMSVLSHLSLRMVTQEGLMFFKQLLAKVQTGSGGRSESAEPVKFDERETRYMKVYNLMTHSHLRTGKDFFRRALMAVFLVKCLKETEYFEPGSNDPDTFSEDEILTASVILHHLEILQFNAHEIYETRISPVLKAQSSKAVYIGVGIYPTAALFNHECAPSVTRYFNGKNIIIKAVRPLEVNEVLSENYGPHYGKKCLRDRTRELTSRYWFHCQCAACVEDWPLVEDLGSNDLKLRCATPHCSGSFPVADVGNMNTEPEVVCWSCFKKTNVRESLKRKNKLQVLFDESLNLMEEENFTEAVPLLTEYLNELFLLCSVPCREVFLAQEALRTCYAQTGNVWLLDEASSDK